VVGTDWKVLTVRQPEDARLDWFAQNVGSDSFQGGCGSRNTWLRGIFCALVRAMYAFFAGLITIAHQRLPLLKALRLCVLAGIIVLSALPRRANGQVEEKFPVLTIGTITYTNVTVTTKSKNYVMLVHSTGLANIKVSELSPEQRQALGYSPEEAPKNKAEAAKKWAKAKLGAIDLARVKAAGANLEANLQQKWAEQSAAHHLPPLPELNQEFLVTLAGVMFALFLFHSALLHRVIQNAGKQPGLMTWLPFLQIFPMLKAASMSPAWILGVPIGITGVVWCFKIAAACGKRAFTGFCLLIPVISSFALVYLAYSGGRKKTEEKPIRRVEIMTLETA